MSLFRRKSADLVADAVDEASAADSSSTDDADDGDGPRAYTAPKGRQTPKRVVTGRRVAVAAPKPANAKEARERRRQSRAEASEGMRRGDDRYLLARDKGEERALVRDIIDSRRTAGTWFFGGALVVLIGSSGAMPPQVQLASNLIWVGLAVAVILDSVLIARKIKRLVRERFPKTEQKVGGLYMYGIMRAVTFRRMRIPRPRVTIGQSI